MVLWILGFPCVSAGKEVAYNAGRGGFDPGVGMIPTKGEASPLQHSGLENFMDCTVHGVAKSWTRLTDFHFQLTKDQTYNLKWQTQKASKNLRNPPKPLTFQVLLFDTKILVLFNLTRSPKITGKGKIFSLVLLDLSLRGNTRD